MQRVVGAVAEARVQLEAEVRGADELLHHELHGVRQPLPAVVGVAGQPGPAALAEGGVGFLEALGRGDHAVLQPAALLVAAAVQRLEDVFANLGRLAEHGVDQVGGMLLVAGEPGQFADVEEFVEHEAHVVERRLVDGHGFLP